MKRDSLFVDYMESFLQSENWAKFQKSLGRKIFKINKVSIIKHKLPFKKSYLYAPRCRGDFLNKDLLRKVKEIAGKESAIFLKIEPLDITRDKSETLLKSFGFKESQNIQPQRTFILDITKSEEELLKNMHYKTRYNIRLAEKKNIKIEKNKDSFENFWRLVKKTTERDSFRPHPKEYYKKMLEIPGVELFLAKHKGKIIAANIVIFYKKKAIYLHGASNYNYRNLMAPHLLQWKQILGAKKRNCTEYDFWGIDEKKWPGVTRFKKGFSGKEIKYIGAYDFVFKPPWYLAYKITKKVYKN